MSKFVYFVQWTLRHIIYLFPYFCIFSIIALQHDQFLTFSSDNEKSSFLVNSTLCLYNDYISSNESFEMSALPCLIAIISIPNYVPNHQYGYRLRHWLHKISIFFIKNFLYSSSADGRHACICNIWWRIIDYYFFVNQFFSLNVNFFRSLKWNCIFNFA